MFKSQNKKHFKGFTLVELIIVITILAILGTIAFISFQGYTKDARDGIRMSDIKQIYNGLSIYKTQTEKTLLPDNYINIQSGTTTISYQGYAGAGVLRSLKISGGKDPGTKDYYIYTTDVNQRKGQLMTYMETTDKDVQLLGKLKDIKLINQANAVTNSGYYQDKKIYVYGDKIGILTNNKIPLQETTTNTGIDITTLTGTITTYFGGTVYNSGTSTSTGLTLINQINGALNNTLPCSSTTYNSYTITSLQDKQNQTFTKTGTITGGTQTGSIIATCNNGILSYGTESFQTSCTGGYSLSGNSCIIVPVLLLHGDNITTSTGFIDSSPSNKTITRNGDTTQVGKLGGVLDLDGNSSYLSVQSSSDWNIGTGDFTIDFWLLNPKNSGAGVKSIFNGNYEGGNRMIYYYSNGNMYIQINSGNAWTGFDLYNSSNVNSGWNHFAVVRSSGVIKWYVNGFMQSTLYGTTAFDGVNMSYVGTFTIGKYSTNYLNTKLDELRVSSGIARWTSNFTPSTGEYTTDSYTKLLLHFNGSGVTFADDSGTSKGITPYGNVTQISPKFGSGSIYFDGAGDFLSLADNEDWNFGSSDFTVDFWILPNTTLNTHSTIFSQWLAGGGNERMLSCSLETPNSNNLAVDYIFGGTYNAIYGNQDLRGSWHHVAIIRNGNLINMYIDGTVRSSTSISGAVNNSSQLFTIGYSNGGDGSYYYPGYIDEFRVVKGVAAWTSNFTPPTSSY